MTESPAPDDSEADPGLGDLGLGDDGGVGADLEALRPPKNRIVGVGVAGIRFGATFFGSILLAAAITMLVIRWRDVTTTWTAAAAGLTLFAAVPLLAGGLLAWIGGSTSLRAVAAVSGVVYVFTMSPVDAVVGCGGTRSDDELTILTANVLRMVSEPEGLAQTIHNSDADMVVLQEVTDAVHDSLRTNELLADYHYWSPAAGAVTFGPRSSVVVVLSKLEARSTQWLDLGASGAADIIFEVPSAEETPATGDGAKTRTVTFTGLHLSAPSLPRKVGPWRQQLATLAERSTDRPAIIAGDFNATEDHRPFRRLLSQGWTDVHEQKGCGFGLTFPINGLLPIPVMRLDHVLVTDHFEVLGVELVDEANSSDHRPVLTHIRFHD